MEKNFFASLSRKLPPFYIVTVNYRTGAYLKELLASIEPLAFVRKVIIVNHSPQEKLENLKAAFPLQVIEQKNAGYGAGLNRGLREVAEGDAIVLLCNPDVSLLTPPQLEEALRYLVAHPRVGCLIPRTVDEELNSLHSCRTFYTWRSLLASRIGFFRRIFSREYREHLYLTRQSVGGPVAVDWGYGAAMLYRLAAFGGQSPFDEDFFLYFEDVDLCARLWRAGLAVVYYPQLVFWHHFRRESHFSLGFFFYHVASLLKFIRKYQGLPQRRHLLRSFKS
jgi:GT2 family glycosyltransferase